MSRNYLLMFWLMLLLPFSTVQAQTPLAQGWETQSYGSQIAMKIKSNLAFDSTKYAENPVAVVEIRLLTTGKIAVAMLKRSSGIEAWDQAVIKAVYKTDSLPLDRDGTVPAAIEIKFYMREN